jgi:hypothetical protein
MVQAEIDDLPYVSVGLDGIVTSSSRSTFSGLISYTATVQAKHLWFGDRQSEYRLEGATMCDSRPKKGQHVRMTLRRIGEDESLLGKIRRFFVGEQPLYRGSICSRFAEAMNYSAMRQAVRKKAALR